LYMSHLRHIVYACNMKTVQQKYTKDKNEEEIGTEPQKDERKTQRYEVPLPFRQLRSLQGNV